MIRLSTYVLMLTGAGAVLAGGYVPQPSDFATVENEATDYAPGVGIPIDPVDFFPYIYPALALEDVTVDTTDDDFDDGGQTGDSEDAVPVVPVNAAFRYFEIVAVGDGGHLIAKFDPPLFDDPRNPCGIDFIIYGNAFQEIGGGAYWTNEDPNGVTIQSSTIESEPGTVAVSQDKSTWHTFTGGPYADDFAPTLGRIYDPDAPDPALGAWNLWWGRRTWPTLPLAPIVTAPFLQGRTVAGAAAEYGYVAGGTGFDLADVGLDSIQYVRITNPSPPSQDFTPEIDAVVRVDADAAPPDLDCDRDVDGDDYDLFESCATGPAVGPPAPGCERADLDNDGDVDHADFSVLQRCFSGADVPANPTCRQ